MPPSGEPRALSELEYGDLFPPGKRPAWIKQRHRECVDEDSLVVLSESSALCKFRPTARAAHIFADVLDAEGYAAEVFCCRLCLQSGEWNGLFSRRTMYRHTCNRTADGSQRDDSDCDDEHDDKAEAEAVEHNDEVEMEDDDRACDYEEAELEERADEQGHRQDVHEDDRDTVMQDADDDQQQPVEQAHKRKREEIQAVDMPRGSQSILPSLLFAKVTRDNEVYQVRGISTQFFPLTGNVAACELGEQLLDASFAETLVNGPSVWGAERILPPHNSDEFAYALDQAHLALPDDSPATTWAITAGGCVAKFVHSQETFCLPIDVPSELFGLMTRHLSFAQALSTLLSVSGESAARMADAGRDPAVALELVRKATKILLDPPADAKFANPMLAHLSASPKFFKTAHMIEQMLQAILSTSSLTMYGQTMQIRLQLEEVKGILLLLQSRSMAKVCDDATRLLDARLSSMLSDDFFGIVVLQHLFKSTRHDAEEFLRKDTQDEVHTSSSLHVCARTVQFIVCAILSRVDLDNPAALLSNLAKKYKADPAKPKNVDVGSLEMVKHMLKSFGNGFSERRISASVQEQLTEFAALWTEPSMTGVQVILQNRSALPLLAISALCLLSVPTVSPASGFLF